MEIASLQVNKFDIRIIRKSIIPQGIHGGTVRLHFQDPIWEGLSKTLVFQGSVARDIVNPGEVVTIPPEVVSTPYCMLMVGVYGVNGEGTIVVPTT